MLELTPISLAKANEFVNLFHRHHKAVTGHKFSIGCSQNGLLVGVVIVGRPVSRYLDDGMTVEVNRLCTLGVKNACSFLYSAAARAAKAMGYKKIITYILEQYELFFSLSLWKHQPSIISCVNTLLSGKFFKQIGRAHV
mgnify:CR=1 FL=1